MRCTQERTSVNPLGCGLARPEPWYTRYQSQHVLAASGVRGTDENASLKRLKVGHQQKVDRPSK